MSFTYNQFVNPNASGAYYSTHFHDPNTGINYNHAHIQNDTHIHGYKGYHIHTNTNPMRSWLIRETINDNSKPVFRSHYVSDGGTSSSILMNPNSRDDAAKFKFSDPPAATEKASDTGNAASNKAALEKLNSIILNGGTSTFGSFSDRLALRRAADENATASDGTTAITTLTSDLSVAKEGIFSYLDYDQVTTIDSMGGKKMNIMPFKEPGPTSTLVVAYSTSGGIGANLSLGTTSSSVEIPEPSITFHGKPIQSVTDTPGIPAGFKQTLLEDISGVHKHYFPLRGQVLNGYSVSHSEFSHHIGGFTETTIPQFPNTTINKQYGSKGARYSMNLNLKSPNTHQFRLF